VPPSARAPLLEREAEVATVRGLVAATPDGNGNFVVVEGPAGIGKTRLLDEAAAIAATAGLRTMSARAGELEGEFAFGVVRQLFEPVLNQASVKLRDELFSGAATHARRLFDPTEPGSSLGDEEASFAILHGLYWLAANASFLQPTLLVIDDLHWTDAPSLRWLDYLVRRLDGLPLLVVAATRPPEQQSGELRLVADLIGRPDAVAIEPRPLGSDSIAQLAFVRHQLEPDDVFTSALEEVTGGNPLFVGALLDAVARERIAPTAAQSSKLLALGGQSVARAVGSRLARLSDAELALARGAAVLGDGVQFRLAAALADLDAGPAACAGAALMRLDLLRRADPLEFTHPVVRSAVYEALDVSERGTAHRRAAELLHANGSPPEAVAAHAVAATPGADPFVVSTLRQAAERALAHGAADASVTYLTRALEEQCETDTRGELLVELGRSERRVDGPAAIEHLGAGLELLTDSTDRATVALDLGRTLWFSDRHREALQVFEQALADVDQTQDAERYEQLIAELISSTWWEPDTYPIAESRLAELERDSLPGGASEVLLATMSHHEYRLGLNRDRSLELARRALGSGHLAASGSPAFSYAGYAFTVSGLFDEALSVYDASLAQARSRGDVVHIASTLMWRGRCQSFRGPLPEAIDDLRQATDLSVQHGVRVSWPLLTGFLAEALLDRGDLDDAKGVLADAGFPEDLRPNVLLGFYQLVRGRLRLETGDVARGLDDLLHVGEVAKLVPADNPAFRPWRRWAAEALRRLDRLDEAKTLAEEELRLANQWGAQHAIGASLRQLGLVLDGDEGQQLLYEAATTLAESGARIEHARALVDLGASFRRSKRRSDARAWLREGIRIAEQVGATAIAERANDEIAATGARPRKLLQTGLDALTASERRVATLAAEGRSNKEIAQLLFVTVKTVEVHLSSVYRKLTIESRAQLGAALIAGRPRADADQRMPAPTADPAL